MPKLCSASRLPVDPLEVGAASGNPGVVTIDPEVRDVVSELRTKITPKQRELLDRIWTAYRSTGKPLLRRELEHGHGGKERVLETLTGLSGSVVYTSARSGS